MAELGVDPSIFARAAALLARPLSPTALEKEQLQKGRAQPEAAPHTAASPQRSSAKAKAKPKPKAKSSAPSPAASPKPKAPPSLSEECISTEASSQPAETCGGAASSTASPHGSQPSARQSQPGDAVADCASKGSILGAIAELSDLQKDWTERLKSPSFRKAPVPKVKRKEPKVLSEEERYDKMEEINALEEELQAAKAQASAVTAAANAAAEWVSQEAARKGFAVDEINEDCDEAGEEKVEAARQAEERVKARKQQQIQERKERERKEHEEKHAKKREAEEKAKALQRATKERMQSRLREQKEKQQHEREEQERRQKEKEDRAAEADELRQQAAKRVSEREQAQRRRTQEIAEQEAQIRREQEEEAEARAIEGRERTRLRMQHHSEEMQAQQMAAEEERRCRQEVEAAQAAQQQYQAQISQQRARARAAEFQHKRRQEQEERARLEAEAHAREQEQAQAVLLERRQRRHSSLAERGSEGRLHGACSSAHASPAGSENVGSVEASLGRRASPERVSPDEISMQQVKSHASEASEPPLHQVKSFSSEGAEQAPRQVRSFSSDAVPMQHPVTKSAPSRGPRSDSLSKRAAGAPPRLPANKASRQPARAARGESEPARSKARRPSNASGSAENDVPLPDGPDIPCRSNLATVTQGGEDEPIRCTVGFLGVSDVAFLGDDDNDAEEDASNPPVHEMAAAPMPPVRSHSRESYSSRHSTPEQRLAAHGPPAGHAPQRAYSQPPPSRPPALPSRAESPRGNIPDGLLSPGAASHNSDPPMSNRAAPRAQAQPWKQKAIAVNSADYYLDLLKEARGQKKPLKSKAANVGSSPDLMKGGAQAWSDGSAGYADQMRSRANAVEATQRQEENARYERGYAALQRVQQRAMQAPSRSVSRDSAPGQLIST